MLLNGDVDRPSPAEASALLTYQTMFDTATLTVPADVRLAVGDVIGERVVLVLVAHAGQEREAAIGRDGRGPDRPSR